MNFGNSSNCVHWLYACSTGTCTSIESSIFGIDPPSGFACVSKGRVPGAGAPRAQTRNLVRLTVVLSERVFAAGVLGAGLGKAAADHVADPDCGDERPGTNVAK